MPARTPARRLASRPAQPTAPKGTLPTDDVRVGIYLRRSTDDEHQPYSIEAQDDRLHSYVDSQPGWRIALRFADDASGANTDRKDLQRALTAARAGLIDVLLVYRVDRLSRNLRDTVTLLEELEEAGVVFRSATEPFDTSTPMGRMLLQMLAMFAQFERETIIDRVIAGMERKAAKGLWKGGARPYGYQVNKEAQKLVIDKNESTIVRLIFDLYTHDRLGTRAIANILNERGHRTTTGGLWAGHQVIRVLDHRVYLGELTFRAITVTGTHEPIIDPKTFDRAEQLLTVRAGDHSHRASNSSDYHLTGRLRCPRCGRPLVGTRATGRNQTYRYYTCHSRSRYGNDRCDALRLDANSAEEGVLTALADLYRDQHDLIAKAVASARLDHDETHDDRATELAAVDAELARTGQAIDRYLTAFERGTLDEETLAGRLADLRTKSTQLRHRRAELADQIDLPPTMPTRANLATVADGIAAVCRTGTNNERKALVEALIEEVKIHEPDRLVPIFRIPQPRAADDADQHAPAQTDTEGVVRAMTRLVGRVGLEPTTGGL